MLLPLKWAKEFADFTCTPHEYAERMTMSGSKVEGFSSAADEIENVVIGKILSIVPHPDSDHMVITQVDVGAGEPVQIVTGAGNLKVGDLVPAALNKSRLPGGKEIRKGKLRGVESNGMLCSLGELGLTKHDFPNAIEDGILVLDEACPVGTPAVKALGLDDTVVEFEITPNRPDCQAVRALGRETAATFGVPFKDHVPVLPAGHGDVRSLLKVSIENKDLCYRYCGAVVENVRVKPSPTWMRERLRNCGVRPINNIVDITNYVMLEYGQPMHCFDYKYVNGGEITVRNARENESIVTLDDVTRALAPEMLVIADQKGPIAIAGVMGGEYSGTYEDTTAIVFESAMFNGPSVRTTSRRLGLRTDASGKYEKGLDPDGCDRALTRALELVAELDAGDVVNGMVDIFPCPRGTRRIPLRPEAVNRLLGSNLSRQQMVDILLPLGFVMDGDDVIVPSSRFDMERDCDIAEEVARYIGYNKFPSTLVRGAAAARPTERQTFDERMSNTLVGYGLYECETFSFYSPKAFDMVRLPSESPLRRPVVISNPLGEDTSVMRTTAVPSLLEVIARDVNARIPAAALFERATEYHQSPLAGEIADHDFNDYSALCQKLAAEGKTPDDLLPIERQKVILAAYGEGWDYLGVKGIVEGLLEAAGVTGWRIRRNTEGTTYHPGRTAEIFLPDESGETLLAVIGEIHPLVLQNYGIKPRVTVADIDLDAVFAKRGGTVQFRSLPKHPAVTRDLALVSDEETPASEIADRIRAGCGKLLEEVQLFDIYRGENIGAGKKSLAFSLTLRAADRTLTDDEADRAVQKVLKLLEEIQVALRS